ncbi:MAG: hypothetical protein R3B06_14650 [Kofleriaceae bacterium]
MRRLIWLTLGALGVSCGDNVSPYEPWLLPTLTAEQGVWVRTPEFDVAAGEEIQDCYFFRVPDQASGALWVDRFEMALNPGSHHMNVFRVKTLGGLKPTDGTPVDLGGVQGTLVKGGECWNSPNWADWPLVGNTQQSSASDPILEWALPPGVATRFVPGEMLMLQVHYVNAATQDTPYQGRAGINMHRSTDGDTMELGTLFATQQNIRVCRSNPNPTYGGACGLPNGSHTVAAANGHFHSRGKVFSIYAWDGVTAGRPPDSDRFYQSAKWAEPDMETGLSVPLTPGGGIYWTCEYQWVEPPQGCADLDAHDPLHANDCCYTFGPQVETGEHCNVFMYYWPKTEDVTCF